MDHSSPPDLRHRDITAIECERELEQSVVVSDAYAEDIAGGFPAALRRAFGALRPAYQACQGRGAFVAVVTPSSGVFHHHVSVEEGPRFLVLGAHPYCPLRVERDPTVSLRHVMLGVSRGSEDDEVSIRAWDLSSTTGMRTETGIPCEALSVEGPLFFRMGRSHVLCFPTGDDVLHRWEETAEETWMVIPPRVYLDQRGPAERARVRVRAEVPPEDRDSVITRVRPRARALGTLGRRRAVRGSGAHSTVTLGNARGSVTRQLEEEDLEGGLLVGRYERCHLGDGADVLSRVHLLIARANGTIWAVDCASTNGTTIDGEEIEQAVLGDHAELVLADAVWLQWRAGRALAAW